MLLLRLSRHVVACAASTVYTCGNSARFFSNTRVRFAPKRRGRLSAATVVVSTDRPKKMVDTLPKRRQGETKERTQKTKTEKPRVTPASSSGVETVNKQSAMKRGKKTIIVNSENNEETLAACFTVDVLCIVEEWGKVCTDVNTDEGEKEETQCDNETTAASAKRTAQFGGVTFGTLLTRAVKQPEEYPTLNYVMQIQQQQQHSTGYSVKVVHAKDVLLNLDKLFALVAFLRVYRTSAFSNTLVYEAVMEELLQATTLLWHTKIDSATEGQQRDVATVKTALMWLSLELRRNYFETTAITKSVDTPKGKGKTKGKGEKDDSRDHRKWLDNTTQRLLSEVAVSAANHIVQETNGREMRSLTEGVVDMALVLLASAMASELREHTVPTEAWEKSTSQTLTSVNAHLQRKTSEEAMKGSLETVRVHGLDLLDALRLLTMVDTVISPHLRECMKRNAADCFLKICSTTGTRPVIFTDFLCTVEMAQRVQALPSRDLVEIAQAAIFTGAALFCEYADETDVNQIMQRMKIKLNSKKDEVNVDVDVDAEDDEGIHTKRPTLRSRRAKIAFALFYVGFDPGAVLGSGLCVGNSALEALELVNAAAFFSQPFAFAPLPPRLSMLLITESEALIEAFIRAENRIGAIQTESIDGPKPLYEIWEECMHLDGCKDLLRDATVTFGTVLYMSLATAVELLVRGEERKLSAHLVRVLTLLEWKGSYHYLVDGLSLLVDGCVERFRVAGLFQRFPKSSAWSSTSLEVERSLSEVTALFVPRVVEAVQRWLAKTKRVSAMSDAEEQAAGQLLREILHFTVYVAACGMSATTAKQLVGVHTTLVKGLVSDGPVDTLSSLSETVIRMNILVSQVGAKQRDFGIPRHHGSPGLRHCSIVLNDVVAVHLRPIAAAIRRGGSIAASQERYQLLSIVSLLFRLVSENAVEAEPAELRAFRTDVLDPALTRVLQQQNSGAVQCDETLDLAALSEITVVMCLPHTIHHLSQQLLDQLAAAVTVAAPKQLHLSRTEDQRRHSSKTAARLLISAAAVCQLRQEERTTRYLAVVEALGPLLLPAEVATVLWSFVSFHVPVNSNAVLALRTFLAEEAGSPKSSLSFPETVSALQVLCDLEDTSRFSYATILRRVINSGYQLAPGEVGIVVRIATKLLQLGGALSPEDLRFLQELPTSLADVALRVRQQCSSSDLSLVLHGFSQLNEDRYGDLKDRVMKAYILRTIQLRLLLGPKEVVECLESYAAAKVSHLYLFGVLLARVTDVKLKFSLPLAVRLVRCGVNATWDKSVQTACLTAAHPVFLGLVRHLLQTDPASLPSVSSNAVMVLQCLTEAFPNDPTSDLVLQNMASHHTALSLSTMMAILKLIARKSSTEYNILRCMTEHAASVLYPQAAPKAFAEMTQWFIKCGVRSRVLFDAVSIRFKEVCNNCDGSVLSILAEAFIVAHVDLEQSVITMLVEHTVILLQRKHVEFQLCHCVRLLKLFSHLDLKDVAQATILLLEHTRKTLETNGESVNEVKMLTADDINVFLTACLLVASPQHQFLAKRCGDALLDILEAESGSEGRSCSGWQTDLMLVVQLVSNMARLGLGEHPTVVLLFDILYEKRSALMRRRLLLQTTMETLQVAGEHAHQQLYALLVKGKLVA